MTSNTTGNRAGIAIALIFTFATIFSGCGAGTTTTPGGGVDTTHVTPVDTAGQGADTSGVTTPIGTTTGTAVTKSIGAAGGSLASADGRMTLNIPAGALASTTTISVQPITNQGPGGVGAGYRLLPDGQTFATPIQISFQHTDADLEGSSSDLLGIAYQETGGHWDQIPGGTYNAAAKTLTVSTSHFTDYIIVVSIKLYPARTTILAGKTLGLAAVDCSYLAGVRHRLRSCVVGLFTVNTWAVNGAPGGTTGSGTVSGGTLSGTYNAPNAVPSPSTVVVSANVIGGLRDGSNSTVTLVSRVTIAEDAWYGTTTSDGPNVSGAFHSAATIKWVLSNKDGLVSFYHPTGTLTVSVNGCSVTPNFYVLNSQGDGLLIVDERSTPTVYRGTATATWPALFACSDFTAPVFAIAFFGGDAGDQGVQAVGTIDEFGIIAGHAIRTGNSFHWGFSRNPP
jgi:hypothetical protein